MTGISYMCSYITKLTYEMKFLRLAAIPNKAKANKARVVSSVTTSTPYSDSTLPSSNNHHS